MSYRRRFATMALGAAASATLLAAAPAVAQASPAHPDSTTVHPADCGYLGYNGDGNGPYYNNCSPYSVEIRIEHFFGHDTYTCVSANRTISVPQGDNEWRIVYAVFDGRTNC